MSSKIMNTENLCDILDRLKGCSALLDVLYEIAGTSSIREEAICGVRDLLDSICKDFSGDIDSAADCDEKAVQG